MPSPESESPPRAKRRLAWLEWGLYLVAIGLVASYGIQWYRHHRSAKLANPTGEFLPDLEAADRIPVEPASAADSNVLVITLDTTRADHIGCYGHAGIRTPVIDAMARKGVLFANAYTPSPATLPGHSSIFTGLYPYRHGARANGSFHLGPENVTLAEILKAEGYATAAFISAYVLDSRFGVDQGFDLYDDDLTKGVKYSDHMFRERPAQYTTDAALAWLESVRGTKFLAWVHYFDPHAPYLPPEPLRSEYADRPYDGEIAYVDHEIGRLLGGIEDLGLLDNTLVVLASDHGEGLGDHGEMTHSLLVYDSTIHTPLIFCPPAGPVPGRIVHRQVSNVDIVPTILDMLGIDAEVQFDGASLLRGPEAHDDTIYAETLSTLVLHGWSPLFAVRREDAKYIHAPKPELYDTKEDPRELRNLFDDRPEQVAALAKELEGHVGQDLYGADALAQMVTMDPQTARKLADLGYVGAVGAGGIDPKKAAALDPKEMVPHWERVENAQNNMALGKFREALEELEACLQVVPDDVWVRRLIASAYLEKGDWARAEEMIRTVLEREKNEPSARVLLGRVLMGQGNASAAAEEFHRALEADPNFAPAYVALGTLAARTEGPDGALEFYRKAIEMDPGTTGPMAYVAIGSMHLGRMEFDSAREAFRAALEIERLSGPAHTGLATILIEEGKLDEAEAELETAVRFSPNDVRVLGTLAALHNKKGHYEQAIDLARRALEINEDYAQALNGLGSALRATGDLDGARAAFEKVLAREPNFVPCIMNLAQVCLAERREEEAAQLWGRALEINSRQPIALFNLGTYKTQRGRPDEAIDLYGRAVAIDPDYALAHQHLGMLLVMQGQPQTGLYHLERSLEAGPDLEERERIRSVVEGLRASGVTSTQPSPSRQAVPE